MATANRVVESSFRIGAGRYIQEAGASRRLGEEILRLKCSRPLILGSEIALGLTSDNFKSSLDEAKLEYEVIEYNEFCNRSLCEEISADKKYDGCDCIVGVGGGNPCDAAKYISSLKDLPIITVPTSSATCAAFTPLSVTYTSDWKANGSVHFVKEINVVLADTDILCRQPERLFAAGVYDSAAKMIETAQRLQGKTEKETDIGLLSSYALSKFIYEKMFSLMDEATDDIKNGRNTKAVNDMIYMTIAVTGVISGLARGSNQCALAHKIYEATRTLFPNEAHFCLHGELVAIGLLAQLYYNGEEEKIEKFRKDIRSHGMPGSLSDMGIKATQEVLDNYYELLLKSTAMTGTNEEEHEKLRRALKVMA